jgi:hypothetical protein
MEYAAPSVPKIKFRRLRIAWSVLAAGACICLVAFWVRSFWWHDSVVAFANFHAYELESQRGELVIDLSGRGSIPWSWDHRVFPAGVVPIPANVLGFRFGLGDAILFMIPCWFVVLVAAGIGIVPWIRWSFSLRTMLIVVTIIAAMLGLARLATFSDAPAAESSATFD